MIDYGTTLFNMSSTVTVEKSPSMIRRVYTNSWFQILLISFICFCCPGVSQFFSWILFELTHMLINMIAVDVQCPLRSGRIRSGRLNSSSQCYSRPIGLLLLELLYCHWDQYSSGLDLVFAFFSAAAGATAYCAWDPQGRTATTRSPTRRSNTSLPTTSTVPAHCIANDVGNLRKRPKFAVDQIATLDCD